jgi:phosphoribosylaminoimidazolecarboxamide formyltransferase/IMP cyclohydrolase
VKALKTSTALVSVTDKSGLADLAAAFNEIGIHILASSGTKAFLAGKGITAEEISAYTQSPEILGGRVKTLHPKIHGGILADRDNPDHVNTLDDQGTHPIDFVVVNLYPFEEKYQSGEVSPEEMVEFIDIGGITLLRAAAKNYRHVTVVTSPAQYDEVIREMREKGATSLELRARLAAETFALTATYDAAIARFMREVAPHTELPERLPIGLTKVTDVRYGENPHQRAALYRTIADSPISGMKILQGRELSFNNYLDIVGAFTLARDLGENAVSIIKHTNPCGAAWCGDVLHSFRRALQCDQTSAFGGIVAVNGVLESELAVELTQMFLEVVIARCVDDEAREVFRKKKNLRVVEMPDRYWDKPRSGALAVYTQDVVLYQDEDSGFPELEQLNQVTKKEPSDFEFLALKKAWVVAKHVKSNAIVIADEEGTVGIGAGQMSRVDSSQIATRKAFDAKFSLTGKVAASDAFFPFADGVKELAQSGISAVIQPGGSIRDQEVIDAADESSVAMVFTGRRHFRHI